MMRLFWSSRSPFARKVMVAAHELGMADCITPERVVVSATEGNPQVMAHNPLGQIPTLLLADGSALFDSAVILEWLDSQHGAHRLLPADAARRFAVLRLQSLGDGIMENSIRRLGEHQRGPLGSPPHAAAQASRIACTLDRLEREAEALEVVTAGSIAIACALAHLDFRHAGLQWRNGRPALDAWHARFTERPAMRATAYRDEH
ncbi:glutathione S-transferase [Roseomonas frigidaquae]|uniref:Glutathione S-transferase n=1 Tax=Falsiroseomonas frigidaquae TaxID=487318 RepID=A0ABX1EVM1_9PROT|nr:glutathione S-transferase N-terminal domain-containing protein [Falsiroseomonas frigidaquae]NKE43145.1 glutathione S-transferase [Falsiroseomonas frigidaquae]